ncbi:hypothetical protein [Streptomyces blattellae]|uniref:hypothetical protein n=1 Tax=Streptomyces blattellae TaxID=2569855 RepID=UPI0012B940B5|nr:hypothetical protein [Streptomyces blattellae]
MGSELWIYGDGALATLPAARLFAFCRHETGYVATEDGEILHWVIVPTTNVYSPALSFLSENSLALHQEGLAGAEPATQIWEFPPNGEPPSTERHLGAARDRWPLDTWRVPVLDDTFAARVYSSARHRWMDTDLPWLPQDTSGAQLPVYRRFLTMSSSQDMFAVVADGVGLEVHSPHLPSARTLLEQPLLHSRPHDVRRIRELRPKIGDPAVRDALDLLTACLSERFGGDIALGHTTPAPTAGPTDLAVSTDHQQLDITHQGDA